MAEGRADLYPKLGPTGEWDTDYEAKLTAAGFHDVEVLPTHVHERAALQQMAEGMEFPAGLDPATTRADDPTPTPTVDPCAQPDVACTDGRVQDSFGD